MKRDSFLREWNDRAGFVGAIALINPIILTAYVLFWHHGPILDFWLIGMGLTFCVCLISGSFMLFVILSDRRKRFKREDRQRMWDNMRRYSSARLKAEAEEAKANKGG